ncbi:hypothetical protein H0I76_03180 [Limibaculum sp. M0105]|uniref:Ca-activated chloride channel family protein n=1 Tax=Thermohalobaculum xanthum TaxID=2753746 RepID=A0A8J7SF08_9RHOB|nr:hypothetical protein [Thermohalobaculum xanthum]MBK0398180.1 hypothetical protein [Thermohalobaculum xanthum]
MGRRRLLLVCLASVLCLVLGGPRALGKVALLLGLPSLAAELISDPVARGAALYRAGRYAEADAAFAGAGRSATYNRGLSLAATGDYALSVAYFDAVLFANPADEDARHNRGIVAAMVEPVIGDARGHGRIAAAVAKIGAADSAEAARLSLPDASKIRKPLEVGALSADADWMNAITDDPGEFLKRRLRAEHERRLANGLILPEEGNPW